MTELLERIAHEKYMAKSIVVKCEMIEQLLQQNTLLQRDIQRLQEDRQKCQPKEMSS